MVDKEIENGKKLIEEKAKKISMAQKRKEEFEKKRSENMKKMASQRDAVLLLTTLYQVYGKELNKEVIDKALEDVAYLKFFLNEMIDVGDFKQFQELKQLFKELAKKKASSEKVVEDGNDVPF